MRSIGIMMTKYRRNKKNLGFFLWLWSCTAIEAASGFFLEADKLFERSEFLSAGRKYPGAAAFEQGLTRNNEMLYHLVMMKFKSSTTEDTKIQLKASLNRLQGFIPEIKAFHCGIDIVRSERSYDFGLSSAFEDMDAMKRYQVHPEHQKVLSVIREICETIVAVDFND
jgi:hypothetical protein